MSGRSMMVSRRSLRAVSQATAHEHVGFEEVGDGVWSLSFYDRLLARLDERDFKLRG